MGRARVGLSLSIIAIGYILSYAVTFTINHVNLFDIGWVLMVMGGVWFLVEVVVNARGGRRADRTTNINHTYDD